MNSMKISAIAALVLVTAHAPSLAQNAPSNASANAARGTGAAASGHGKGEFMETYDANSDGKVSKAEFAARRTADHKGLDLDQNSSVTQSEYIAEYSFRLDKELAERRAGQLRQAYVRFGVLDTNKDGVLSADEFNASGDRMFSRLDTTQDGNVDASDTAKGY